MREMSDRSLTRAYVVALAIVALMSGASHVALNHILKAQDGSAAVLNISGRQRMLSQRIAGSAAELALGIDGSRETLITSLDAFERAHHDLTFGNPALHLPAVSLPEIRAMYFGGPAPLDAAVADFVARGRRLAALSSDEVRVSPDLASVVTDARTPLLDRLNAVVCAHQRLSEMQLGVFKWLESFTLGVVLLTLLCEALLIFRPMVTRIAGYTKTLVTMASTDHLTQVANRRSLVDRAEILVRRAHAGHRPLSVLMIDVDRFKAVNDTHGHAAGDAVLQALCQCLAGRLKPTDLLGRLGGEEFCVVLPDTPQGGAAVAAEQLRMAVAGLDVPVETGSVTFTISVGIAELSGDDMGFQAPLDRADRAVYQAKAAGRNRVVAALPPAPKAEAPGFGVRVRLSA